MSSSVPLRGRVATPWLILTALALLGWAYGWQSYPLYLLTQVLTLSIAVMGLNLLVGYTGQTTWATAPFLLGLFGFPVGPLLYRLSLIR
jgi:branched-chain amino acid transport system permease protein